MTRLSVLLGVALGAFTASTLLASPQVIFFDDFEGYDVDERPPYVTLSQTARVLEVQEDADNWFGAGTDNQFLQARKAGQHSILIPTGDANSQVVTLSFDFITRNLPAEDGFGADTRWVNINFYAGDPDVVELSNPYRAHITSLRLTNATVRSTALDNPSYGALDEHVRFDMGFNNSTEPQPYYDPDGNLLGILPAGMASVWVNGNLLVEQYNESRQAAAEIGWNVHGVGFVFDSATIASYDLDNLTVTVPEPSSAAILIGLAGLTMLRRRNNGTAC